MSRPPISGRGVVGLDLSLTRTGIATAAGVTHLRTEKLRGMHRLAQIVAEVEHQVTYPDTLVVVEGYSFGSRNSHAHALGELGGCVRLRLWRLGHEVVDVPPSTLKMYATGKGNVGKVDVVIAARDRLGYQGSDDNEADALWLRALGCDLIGDPIVEVPKQHGRALDKIEWTGKRAA